MRIKSNTIIIFLSIWVFVSISLGRSWFDTRSPRAKILLMLILVIITMIIIVSFHLLRSFWLVFFVLRLFSFLFFPEIISSRFSYSHLLFSLSAVFFLYIYYIWLGYPNLLLAGWRLLYRSLCYHFAAVPTAAAARIKTSPCEENSRIAPLFFFFSSNSFEFSFSFLTPPEL
jgi:hypothetical protein